MKKKIINIILAVSVILSLTACGSTVDNENSNTSTENLMQIVSTEAEPTEAVTYNFSSTESIVTFIKTAVLCEVPEKAAGYVDFIYAGTAVKLTGVDDTGTWSMIEYKDKKYYVLSDYLSQADDSE